MTNINFNEVQIKEMYLEQKTSFYWRLKYKCLKDLINRYTTNESSVLDIGCGTGFMVSGTKINPQRYLGIDAFPESEIYLKTNFSYSANFSTKKLEDVENETFDCILLLDVLEHIDDDQAFICEIKRIAKQGSNLIVSVPAHQWLYSDVDKQAGHIRRYNSKEFVNLFHSTGFKKIYHSSFLVSTLPLQYISRKLIFRNKAKNINEHFGFINKLLLHLIFFEYILFSKIQFKFGGSIVAVFRKV